MAKKMKINKTGAEITYRRLYWGERKELRKQGLMETDKIEECIDTVLSWVVEPKECVDDLDMDEVNKIYFYAMGMRYEEEEKN